MFSPFIRGRSFLNLFGEILSVPCANDDQRSTNSYLIYLRHQVANHDFFLRIKYLIADLKGNFRNFGQHAPL